MYKKSAKWYIEAYSCPVDMAAYRASVIYKMQKNISSHLSDFRLEKN